MNKYYKKGLFSAVAVVLVFLVAIALNLFVTWKDYSVDVTSEQLYSLSKQTKKILKNVDEELTFYVLNAKSETNSAYERILNRYKKESPRIKVKYRDPELYPNFASKYTEQELAADSIIVVGGKKSQCLASDDFISYDYGSGYSSSSQSLQLEKLLTEAVNYVTSTDTPVVYTLSGHQEQNLPSELVSSFRGDNYEVKSLNFLSTDHVPKDCAVLVINGAKKDISEDERGKIKTYMDNGGKMYVFLDAGVDNLSNLHSLLKEYRVKVEKGVVIETDSNRYTQYPVYLLPEISSSDVTADQYDDNVYILTPSAKGLKEISGEKEKNKYTVTSLLTTSEGAYSKVDTDSSTMEKEKMDIDGPFAISLAVSDESGGRMIVTGCSNMAEVDYAVAGANTDFILNGINYLSEQESKISIRTKDLTLETAVVPAFVQKMTLIFCVFVFPLCILAVGIFVTIRRRRL